MLADVFVVFRPALADDAIGVKVRAAWPPDAVKIGGPDDAVDPVREAVTQVHG